MIDTKKRLLVAAISAATGSAALPALTMAANDSTNSADVQEISLSFSQRNGKVQIVTLSNNSSNPVLLKHVYPGIVQARGQYFDLNSLFSNEPLLLEPGRSQSMLITAINHNTIEQPIPEGLTLVKPMTVSTYYEAQSKQIPVSTVRSYLA